MQPATNPSAAAIFFPASAKFVSLQGVYPREVFSSLPLLKYDEKLPEGWGQIVSLLWLKQKVKDQRYQIVDNLSTVETRSTGRACKDVETQSGQLVISSESFKDLVGKGRKKLEG